jgi:geranylgeranyl pyrophosphate synthase
MVQQRSIIDEAFAIAEQRCNVSREALLSLPKNPSRDSLEELLNYVITRRS